MNIYIIFGFVILGIVSTALLILILFIFGNLMWLQFRVWFLAKKGYHLIEHVGEDKVRRYFYAKPKDKHFEFDTGFYAFVPETTSYAPRIIKSVDKKLIKELPETQQQEIEDLARIIKDLKYDRDATTIRWGIPTITYYGSNPEPFYFQDRKKQYDAKTFRDMYLRILLTRDFNFLRKIITFGIIALVIIAIVLIIYYFVFSNYASALQTCSINLNETSARLVDFINRTMPIVAQPRNITI